MGLTNWHSVSRWPPTRPSSRPWSRDLLYFNQGDGTFRKESEGDFVAYRAGAMIEGGAAGDMDGDGDLDILLCSHSGIHWFENDGTGQFRRVTTGFPTISGTSITPSWADYDNNGFQDLFVTSHAGFPEVLYRNHGNGNHWISFKLVGTRSNRSAIGAKVRVRAAIFGRNYWQLREIGGGNRHQNDLRPHFGLGDAPRATTVRVEWPSGTVEEFANLARDQYYTIVEPNMLGALKPNGGFELSLWASTNRTCTLEHSPDLETWTVLTTVPGQGQTPVTYLDTAAPGQSHRFYRMK
jgi:enediyne biosynthesis protein E4